ncbi:hypothetical protein AMTR_s00114p00109200 [Amborella trichopoda]|uniref:PARP1-like PADR1 domain-containing protein n=1 Tax=Amborella trichopoda TaxID=13333 RepID=W1NW63_AMBTC|nr:hypothetical protein AMTR_s00114p00109200 [Amborella trichopoda]
MLVLLMRFALAFEIFPLVSWDYVFYVDGTAHSPVFTCCCSDSLSIFGLNSHDLIFYGPVQRCPVCGNFMECTGINYKCMGTYSVWTTCNFNTTEERRRDYPLKFPDELKNNKIAEWSRKQDLGRRPHRELMSLVRPLVGMMFSLSGRLSCTHEYWRQKIEDHGGKVANSVAAERERGGASKVADAMYGSTFFIFCLFSMCSAWDLKPNSALPD